ncbi:MAG: glycosyltransferase family 2 protein [Candidatus Krumholzibacteriota bacterium]|nr:glycosyltransferase family 2 protein [Candidatus Krumholzibacteriota bacterium]
MVNWNTGGQLRECLASLRRTDRETFELRRVVIVDNASSDRSAEGLDPSGLPLELIRNEYNRGFGAACNQGARDSRADYILFLNPDTILRPDSIRVPLDFMRGDENGRFGIAGIQLIDEEGRVGRTCARFPGTGRMLARALGLDRVPGAKGTGYVMQGWAHDGSRMVDHVIGAFYLVRGELFKRLGGFDERFFVYLEDLDFSLRASREGYRAYYHAGTSAFHKGGGSSAGDRSQRLFYALRSRIFYARKHFTPPGASLVTFFTLAIEPVIRLISALARFSSVRLRETVGGYKLLWTGLPGIVKGKSNG